MIRAAEQRLELTRERIAFVVVAWASDQAHRYVGSFENRSWTFGNTPRQDLNFWPLIHLTPGLAIRLKSVGSTELKVASIAQSARAEA